MQGMLLIDKPADWTSFDVVNYVRRMVAEIEGKKPKNVKVGHCGTLDPFATGLLILLIGKEYTKKADQYSKLDKSYSLTMILGSTSSTGDTEGDFNEGSDKKPSIEAIDRALKGFQGEIQQIPPAFSAIKVNGQRAYKLAREGKEVILEPRSVTINKLEVASYNYPELKLVTEVSSGTYIRSLVEDIGKELGVGAYTKELRRLTIDKFNVEQAVAVKQLNQANIKEYLDN
jgi:tRNA pseudouridine55 synthase